MPKELYEQTYTNADHFSFGKNWTNFLLSLDEKRIENAKRSLCDFLGEIGTLRNKTFVDIGCGSGIFSLAAYRLGAAHVVSVDIDRFSIACAEELRNRERQPEKWSIQTGSALDPKFLLSLGTFDIVYSWGVLHHTGNMYKALENITLLMKDSGRLYIAIYNDNQKNILEGTSTFWLEIKKIYNQVPWIGKKVMKILYTIYYVIGLALSGKNPILYIKNYQSLRGMSFMTDIKDWLGGYPYEYASSEKIIAYFKERGFECTKTNPARSIGCNEFLFVKKS